MHWNKRNLLIAGIVSALAWPAALFPYSTGPIPYVTGDPQSPDSGATCIQSGCHTGTALNVPGAGSVTITVAGGQTYVPGKTRQISVTITDPKQRAWGFELTARVLSTNAQAGSLSPADSSTWVQCADGSPMPTSGCPAIFNTQFIQHSAPKTGVGSGTFTFSWTAPATSAGTIVLYAAGNAANGDGTQLGDHIYTTSLQPTISPPATMTQPTGASPASSASRARSRAAFIHRS